MTTIGMSHELGEIIAERLWLDYRPGKDNCMGLFRDGRALGGILFKEYNYVNIEVHWLHFEGDHWLGKRSLWAICDYCFNQLGCERMTAYQNTSNEHLMKLMDKLGFRLEATQYGYFPDGDRACFVMRRDTCPWLKYGERYGRK